MRDDVRTTGKRPRDAFTDMMTSVPKKFKSATQQTEVVLQLPSFQSVRRQLSRHRAERCTPVPDPCNIPDVLRVTLRAREADDDSPYKNEQFLRYSGQQGKLLVFCCVTELRVLYESEFVVCDGTFEVSPDTSYQLYTLHGFLHGAAMALVYALLPNKSRSTYVELFQALRNAFLTEFGDVGNSKTFLVDFEIAAIQALNSVFPDSRVKGCSFHFRQAVYRRVQREGLTSQYEDAGSGVRRWIRQLLAMTALPTFAVPLVWSWLKAPPVVDPLTDVKTRNLAAYFDSTWIGGDFPASLWSQYDNNGPRTTNVAEGFHNGLNSRFGMPHPSLRLFLDWLQKYQFEVQCRGLQLLAGRPPKPRSAAYVQVDADLWAAKLTYSLEYGRLFCCYGFVNADTMWQFRVATDRYLARVCYLVAGQ